MSMESMGHIKDKMQLVPAKTRITIDAIAGWWGCSSETASSMLNASRASACQPKDVSWMQLRLSRTVIGNIAEFEDLVPDQKVARRSQTNHALDQRDSGRSRMQRRCHGSKTEG